MNTLENFIENQAEDLLQQSDLVNLTGGERDRGLSERDINALAHCETTNNCHAGNCTAQCGCGKVESN